MIFLTFMFVLCGSMNGFFGFSLIVKTKQEYKMKLLIFSISMQCERNEWENPHPTSPPQPFPSSTLCGKYFHIVSGRGKVFSRENFSSLSKGKLLAVWNVNWIIVSMGWGWCDVNCKTLSGTGWMLRVSDAIRIWECTVQLREYGERLWQARVMFIDWLIVVHEVVKNNGLFTLAVH